MALAQPPEALAVLVIGMLALGIGATVAVFSLINGLFLQPFPFPEPERLVYINETAPKWNLEHDRHQLRAISRSGSEDQQAFEAIALYDERDRSIVATDEGADRMDGASVTDGLREGARHEPVIGRMFTPEEDRPNGPAVALIGEAVWHERFGGRDRTCSARTLRLNSRMFTIIGVLPQSRGVSRRRAPLDAACKAIRTPATELLASTALGRLKPGRHARHRPTADLVRAHQPIFDTRDKEKSGHAVRARPARSSSRATTAPSRRRSAPRCRCC